MTQTAHTPIGGSTAGRTVACPGSVRFCAGLPRADSAYSREGTAAHRLLEMLLTNPDLNVWEITHVKLADGSMFEIDMEMRDCVRDCAQRVQAVAKELGYPVDAEVRFDLAKMLPDDLKDTPCRGTADVKIYQPFGALFVLDYKHGVGTPVDAKGNAQLRFYAIGALSKCLGLPETIRIAVFQPRSAHGAAWSEETLSLEELNRWWADIMVPAIREAEGPNPTFAAGPHCKFCSGAGTCKEIARSSCAAAGLVFAGTAPLAKADIKVKPPEDCTDEQLRRCLDAAEIIQTWCEAAKEEVTRRLENGGSSARLGYKFVAGRSNRTWKDESEVRKQFAAMGADILTPQKLITPAKMEELIKSQKGDVSVLEPYVVKSQPGRVLAPVSDKRPALTSAQEVFKPKMEDLLK